jgi:hypothetical protein
LSSCARGSAFCTSTTLRMAVGSASTAWRICSREVNSTSAPYSTRAMSCSSASTTSAVNCAAFLGSARVSGCNQRALGGVVEGAVHLQRGGGLVALQAGLAQEEIELAAAGERGRGQHRAAHRAPQVVAQRGAGQDGAGVRLDDDEVAIHLQREPLGGGHAASGLGRLAAAGARWRAALPGAAPSMPIWAYSVDRRLASSGLSRISARRALLMARRLPEKLGTGGHAAGAAAQSSAAGSTPCGSARARRAPGALLAP